MRPKRQVSEESSAKVPAYIVTFSDMVTLLLTFFVMLLSLAETQDPELFNKGRDAFLDSIRYIGLGVLFGRKEMPDFGNVKLKYFIPNPDESFSRRSIDAKEEELRRIFKKIDQSITTMPSQIVAEKTDFSVTNIRFAPGDSTLNEPAKRFLTEFCAGLQQDLGSKGVTLYVLGLASDAAAEKGRWILSARRAQAAADFLQETLSPGARSAMQDGTSAVPTRWPVYSWGAGPGGNWVDQDSPISRQSQILIAVLRTND